LRGKIKKPTAIERRMSILVTGPAAGAGAQEAIMVKLFGKKITSKESGHPQENKTKEIKVRVKRHSIKTNLY
jgi:hypothetical protein